jgi:apolipoprotein N-acyltransferase
MHGCAGIAHRAISSRAARSRARAAAPHRVAPAAAAQTQPLLGARAEADGLAAPAVVLALASGALLALAAPPFDCSWLAWVALVPLLLGLPARPWPALVCGTVIGASLFLGVGYGLFAFSAGALLAVVVGLALLLGVVFGTASWLEQSPLPPGSVHSSSRACG